MTPELHALVDSSPEVMTTSQVAQILKVSPRHVSRLFDSRRLKGYRIPGSQDVRITKAGLMAYLDAHGLPTEDVAAPPTPEPTAHEIKQQFVRFIAFAATVRPRNTPEWMEAFVEEATKAANFLDYSGRYELRHDLIQWSDE